ncbi:hypothetical protein D3C72_2080340 [compost metagenome]
MPSSRWKVAPVGQTSRQAGSAQWLQSLGNIKREAGASSAATSLTSYWLTVVRNWPRGGWFSMVQATVQA